MIIQPYPGAGENLPEMVAQWLRDKIAQKDKIAYHIEAGCYTWVEAGQRMARPNGTYTLTIEVNGGAQLNEVTSCPPGGPSQDGTQPSKG